MEQEYALMSHKITACVVDGEYVHPTHNQLPNAHASSPKMSKSQRHMARRAISDSGASKQILPFSRFPVFPFFLSWQNLIH